MKRSFYIESLGCAKNSVDSESISAMLLNAGYSRTSSPEKARVILVNTCGFIRDARTESLSVLEEYARNKRGNQFLIAAGCMAHQSPDSILRQVPGVDALLSTRRWMDVVNLLKQLESKKPTLPLLHGQNADTIGRELPGIPRYAIQGSSAYIKIADGCQRPCAFCAIPLIKGRLTSREISSIIDEASGLFQQGIKEIILIAQDTTEYGSDLGYNFGLEQLIESLINFVPGLPWIRIMYTYPGKISDRLIDLFTSSKSLLPYLDLPLQHAHPNVLKRMRRPSDIDWARNIIGRLRSKIPYIALRTTFIVGFPGENDQEFQFLMDFINEIKFDHVGAFTYSHEEGTPIYDSGDTVPDETKLERYNQLMLTQQEISLEKSSDFIGKTLDVLIEGSDNGVSVGRSYRDAPEIDGMVIINDSCKVGEIIPVSIIQALPYDLIGKKAGKQE